MAVKQRYTVSLPEHIAKAIDDRATIVSTTPTEYTADILRWWFGQGCPPVTHDEVALLKGRLKPLPANLDIWHLDPEEMYAIVEDARVKPLLSQLGIPNLFAAAQEHDRGHMFVAFDNHPTHWIAVHLFKGGKTADENGLALNAYPKSQYSEPKIFKELQDQVKEMHGDQPFAFNQLPVAAPPSSPRSR